MSHFVVVVVGDDVEGQLAPFNEQDEKYLEWQEADVDALDEFRKYGFGMTYAEYCEENGYKLRGSKAGLMRNPNAKWDWWCVGGRWPDSQPGTIQNLFHRETIL